MSNQNLDKEVWLTTDEVCEYLKISKKALLQRCYRRAIPYYKFGRQNRYLKAELDALIQATKDQQEKLRKIQEIIWELSRQK
jgi:excisionase family DNA binding protein